MDDLIRQIRLALEHRLYHVALFPALTLPDICGALESPSGEASKSKFVSWFDRYMAADYSAGADAERSFTGDDCYYYRCSLLHQGRSDHRKSGYKRVLFVEPAAKTGWNMHSNVVAGAFQIDVDRFCRDVLSGVERWLDDVKGSADFQRNYGYFIRYWPKGHPDHLQGIPLYT